MAKCEDCEGTVVWLKKSDGRWFPPVEPILDLADGEHVIATAEGFVAPIPQVYRRHRCLSPDEREAKRREREEEKWRLIEEDRARRAEARRVAEERAEYEREQARLRAAQEAEERALQLRARQLDWATQNFAPQRLLTYACSECGAEEGEPCRTARHGEDRLSATWWRETPHPARRAIEPLWGDDYTGPWPPRGNQPGYLRMQRWLKQNAAIFDTDETKETHDDEGPYDPADVL